jgi:hypothetical protein
MDNVCVDKGFGNLSKEYPQPKLPSLVGKAKSRDTQRPPVIAFIFTIARRLIYCANIVPFRDKNTIVRTVSYCANSLPWRGNNDDLVS